ncbi:MAG: dTMP kinase [Mariprofundaceae bacterium]
MMVKQLEFKHEGRLITFEGGDGCGKSTQLALTADWLREQGKDVLLTREPGDTPLGKELRLLLLSGEYTPVPECELLMFLADRAQHVREVLMPALKAGQWVLCDRYSDSTLAYQLAARHLGQADALRSLLAFAELGVSPDITIWLDLPVQEALRRIRSRNAMGEENTRLDEEALSFHEQVHAAFKNIAEQNPNRVSCINANQAVELVQHDIRQALEG